MNLKVGALALNSKVKTKKVITKAKTWNKKAVFIPILVLFSVIAAALTGYGSYAYAYRNRIYPNVKIAGSNLGGKTTQEAEKILQKKFKKWQNKEVVAVVSDKEVKTTFKDIGISYDPTELAQKAYAVGHDKNWLKNGKDMIQLSSSPIIVDLTFEKDNAKFNQFVAVLSSQIEQPAEMPHFEIQSGQIKLVLGQPGIKIETKKLKTQILDKASNGIFEKIEVPAIKTQITVPEDQAQKIVTAAENYTKPITFTYEGQSFTADKQQILNWLVISENEGNFSVTTNESAIAGYVGGLAWKVNINAKFREVTPSGQVLSEGAEGKALNQTKVMAEIKSALKGGSRQIALEVNPVPAPVRTIYPDGTPGLFPGRYLELSLSKQTLYAFDGQTLVNSGLISSGISSHPTPAGVFSIWGKSRVTRMRGEDYDLPGVKWVSWFYGDYSIHGTYWHSNFGHPMSHGCVNATNAYAAWIFDWAPVGTPVVIHY